MCSACRGLWVIMMGYRYLEQTVWFESLLIHRVSPLKGLKPLFFMEAAVSAVWACGQDVTLFSVFWSASAIAGWKRLAGSTLHEAGLKQKIHGVCFALCPCVVKACWSRTCCFTLHWVKEVCFLSGRYVCSCQQGGQEIVFDLTLIWLNIFRHSIRPPLIGVYVKSACLSSVL